MLAAGTDFRSDRLWEAYANWETELEKLANVTAIYDRVMSLPTQLYSQHFQRYKDIPDSGPNGDLDCLALIVALKIKKIAVE